MEKCLQCGLRASKRASKERQSSPRPLRSALLSLSFSLAPSAPLCLPLSDVNRVNRDGTRGNNVYARELYYVGSIPGGTKDNFRSRKSGPQLPGAHGRWASATGRKYMPASMRLAPPNMHPGRGHSVPTVTELIFVGAQRFTNRAF